MWSWRKLAHMVCGVALLGAWLLSAPAQTQQPPLGEQARRAREQKKPAAKPARVWTNDDLPSSERAVNLVGPEATPAQAQAPAAAARAKKEETEKARTETETALAEARARLQRAQRDLELLQRDYDLQRQQYYSNP